MNATRPTGAITRKLDPDTLLAIGRKHYLIAYPGQARAEDLQNGPQPQMLFGVDNGKTAAVVNGEGVGSTQDEEGRIDVYFSNGYSTFRLAIPLDELTDAVTDATVDLAHGIRTFGGRLETNFYNWHRAYSTYI